VLIDPQRLQAGRRHLPCLLAQQRLVLGAHGRSLRLDLRELRQQRVFVGLQRRV
jgi:hypothetical protein